MAAPKSVHDWLVANRLEEYSELFSRNGYFSVSDCLEISDEKLVGGGGRRRLVFP